eukprot:4465394-Amphidinium_carterae.1
MRQTDELYSGMQQRRDAESELNRHQTMKYYLKLQNYQTTSSCAQKKRGKRSTTTRKPSSTIAECCSTF